MSRHTAMIPDLNKLSPSDGWHSVHEYLPINKKDNLLVVYKDIHGSGVTSAILERGRFLSITNRALLRGVRAWRHMQE